MKLAIWGAGAVGLGLASALAGAGDRPRILVRDARTRARLAAEGLLRTGRFGRVSIPPDGLRLEPDASALAASPPAWLLVCTKAFSSASVAAELAPLAGRLEETALVLCQNGWGNERPFLDFWPRDRLFHARVITGFQRRAPNAVEVTAHAAPIALGSLTGADPSCLEPLAARLRAGGLPAETTRDMRGVLWAKMLYNCALNPLGALAGRRYGELAEDPHTRPLLEAVVGEIFDVLRAARVEVAWPDAAAYLETFHRELLPPTAEHESSMLQDLRAGRPTEIEALCGAVERLAARHGVATPVVTALAVLVRQAEARGANPERGPSEGDPDGAPERRATEEAGDAAPEPTRTEGARDAGEPGRAGATGARREGR